MATPFASADLRPHAVPSSPECETGRRFGAREDTKTRRQRTPRQGTGPGQAALRPKNAGRRIFGLLRPARPRRPCARDTARVACALRSRRPTFDLSVLRGFSALLASSSAMAGGGACSARCGCVRSASEVGRSLGRTCSICIRKARARRAEEKVKIASSPRPQRTHRTRFGTEMPWLLEVPS
jgi:hypothetical protein